MKKYFILFITAAFVIVACSRKNAPTGSIAKITYTDGVTPILQSHCTPCHFPSKGGKVDNFETYDGVKNHLDEMIVRVQLDSNNKKFMPFKNKKPALSSAQIDTLKRWASDGYIR